MGLQGQKNPARLAEAASSVWKPWRSYAVVRAWSGAMQALPDAAAASAIDALAESITPREFIGLQTSEKRPLDEH